MICGGWCKCWGVDSLSIKWCSVIRWCAVVWVLRCWCGVLGREWTAVWNGDISVGWGRLYRCGCRAGWCIWMCVGCGEGNGVYDEKRW